MPKQLRPFIEGLAVDCVFISVTIFFEIPLYMSFIIGALAAIGSYRNSIKMYKEKVAKKEQHQPQNTKKDI